MDPIALFNEWYQQQLTATTVKLPAACCLSTIGLDGFPNARFVSLKEVLHGSFVVTGPTTSLKGQEINADNKVSLTFWWPETERQVRVQGIATLMDAATAYTYFKERNRESQLVSLVSTQGADMGSEEEFDKKYEAASLKYADTAIPLPDGWGAYSISPVRIEFLGFRSTRFHDRQLFELLGTRWAVKKVQP